jgi:hypothetical protein
MAIRHFYSWRMVSCLILVVMLLHPAPGTAANEKSKRRPSYADQLKWQNCKDVSECVVGLECCGHIASVHKDYLDQFKDWSRGGPCSCPYEIFPEPRPGPDLRIMCLNARCTVGNVSGMRTVEDKEVPTPDQWKPYIWRGR